jgi:UDP-N-acetylmuramoyl-tripeptide--D-alanyl-D-alanine ligase (EC 6.3.2.10)
VTIGEYAKAIAKAVRDSEVGIETVSFMSNTEAITYLKDTMAPQDAVLVKGSRGMHTDEIVKALLEEI